VTRSRSHLRGALALLVAVLAIATALAVPGPAAAAPVACGVPCASAPNGPTQGAPTNNPPVNPCPGVSGPCASDPNGPTQGAPTTNPPGNSPTGTDTPPPSKTQTPPPAKNQTPPPAGTSPPAADTGGSGNPLSTLKAESEGHEFPIDNYGLDEQVQFGITHPGNVFDKATQWIIQSIWQLVLYVFNGVMVMLQWAFTNNLLQSSMSKLGERLQTLREHIDTPWGLAAVAALSLWGIWNGLIRKKSIDTVRGLAISLLCMVGLLVVIGNPGGTLGQVTNTADGASTEMLNSITSGKVSQPQQSVGSTEASLFKSVILQPWCALQFGDISYCESKPGNMRESVADTWLEAPPDSEWRTYLWQVTSSEDEASSLGFSANPPSGKVDLASTHELAGNADKVSMISSGNVMPRLGLLMLILVGVVGAICLFCYLAIRLLMAALFVLVLVMFAPAMFLVAALGESGRASVVAWATRLLGAILTKVVFALFLAVIVEASNLVTELNLGFFPTWIVFIAFWWGVLLKRKDLLALLSLDPKTATPSGLDFNGAGGGNALSELFYAKQLTGDVRRGARRVARGVTAAPRALGRRGRNRAIDSARGALDARRHGQSDAGRQLAQEQLEREASRTLQQRYAREHQAELTQGRRVLAREKQLKSRLADPAQSPERRARAQQELTTLQSSSAYARARNPRSKPREVTRGPVQDWIAGRRAEIARGSGADANLEAAGIDPKQHRKVGDSRQIGQRLKTREVMKEQSRLLDVAGVGHSGDKAVAMSWRQRRKARADAARTGHTGQYQRVAKERAAAHRQQFRQENRYARRRGRRNVR
jgi:hypothetical protein